MLAGAQLLLQLLDLLLPLHLGVVVADRLLLQIDLLLADLLAALVEILVAVQRLLQIALLLVGRREQAEDLELALGVTDLVGQCQRVFQLQDGDARLLLFEMQLTQQQQGVDQRLLVVPQLVGLAGRGEVVAGQGQVAGFQIGFAYLVLEVGDAGAVVALVQQIQGIEEVDQRHVHLALFPVEAGQHDEGVAQQGGIAEGMEVVGRLVGVLQSLLRLLLLLIEVHYLVRQQAEEQRILQPSGLLLGIDVVTQRELWLFEGVVEVAAHRADPGAGQRILGLIRPATGFGQLTLGLVELVRLYAGVGAQQSAVHLQLALFQAGGAEQGLQLAEQAAAGAVGALLQVLAADLQIEAVGLQLQLLLFGRHGDALIEGLLGRLELAKLQQALPLEQVGTGGLGGGAIAQQRLPIAVLLTIADDLLGIIGCAGEEG